MLWNSGSFSLLKHQLGSSKIERTINENMDTDFNNLEKFLSFVENGSFFNDSLYPN